MLNVPDKMRWFAIVMTIAGAFAAGVAVSFLQGGQQDAQTIDGLLWPNPRSIESFALRDEMGIAFTEEALRGRWSLVFFGFTHCPDICPTTLDLMARAHTELKAHRHYAELGQIVFVSVDPDRDTPEVLREYVHYFDPELIGLNGSVEDLTAFTRQLGALFIKIETGSGIYTIDHSAGIFFIDPELRLVSVITPPHNLAAIVKRFDAVSTFVAAQK